jgi:hypothetical protein
MPLCLHRSHLGMPWSQRVLLILHGSHEAGLPFRLLAFLRLVSWAANISFGMGTLCVALFRCTLYSPCRNIALPRVQYMATQSMTVGKETWQRKGVGVEDMHCRPVCRVGFQTYQRQPVVSPLRCPPRTLPHQSYAPAPTVENACPPEE